MNSRFRRRMRVSKITQRALAPCRTVMRGRRNLNHRNAQYARVGLLLLRALACGLYARLC